MPPPLLTLEQSLIFRITHAANVPWILANGLHSRSSQTQDPSFRGIGHTEIIARRTARIVPVPPGGTLADYVPFYFTPWSPMLYNIKTGYQGFPQLPMSEVVLLVASLRRLAAAGSTFLFTDRHAVLETTRFHSDLNDLQAVDWSLLQARDFKRDPRRPDKLERYQAEALIHRHLPVAQLEGIACYDEVRCSDIRAEAARLGLSMKTIVNREWFFE